MNKKKNANRKFIIKTYSVKEVAALYEISNKTLKKWLTPFKKQIGKRIGHFYSPKQIKIIFKQLGTSE